MRSEMRSHQAVYWLTTKLTLNSYLYDFKFGTYFDFVGSSTSEWVYSRFNTAIFVQVEGTRTVRTFTTCNSHMFGASSFICSSKCSVGYLYYISVCFERLWNELIPCLISARILNSLLNLCTDIVNLEFLYFIIVITVLVKCLYPKICYVVIQILFAKTTFWKIANIYL